MRSPAFCLSFELVGYLKQDSTKRCVTWNQSLITEYRSKADFYRQLAELQRIQPLNKPILKENIQHCGRIGF